ncbi:MAG: hypothetical protein ACTS73_07170 [Arsenophonus sp. NEOnobi-MAG3]
MVCPAADTRDAANKTLDVLLVKFSAKYPAAMKKLEKDRERTAAILRFFLRTVSVNKKNESD